jgi:hypothetical protein
MRIIQIIEEKDKKFMDIQALIEAKRNMLINKQQKLAKIAKQNQFLDTIKTDYLKYYNYITQQKREQIQAMELLNTYIKDLSETGQLTKQNMEDAKAEQEKIMNEVKSIKGNLDNIIDNIIDNTNQ